jgi:hypothetical protein
MSNATATDKVRYVKDVDEDGEWDREEPRYIVYLGDTRLGMVRKDAYGDTYNPWSAYLSRDIRKTADGRSVHASCTSRKEAGAWFTAEYSRSQA